MSHKERLMMLGILGAVFLLVITDIISDFREGVEFGHLLLEASMGAISLFGIFYVLKDSFLAKKNLAESNKQLSALKIEAQEWRAKSKKYVEGLSSAIDEQLSKWELTPAEKEVAFLLLKGLSLKEVATARNTTEKTARVQSMSIYAKAGISSRSELSAFFLEDLLAPQEKI